MKLNDSTIVEFLIDVKNGEQFAEVENEDTSVLCAILDLGYAKLYGLSTLKVTGKGEKFLMDQVLNIDHAIQAVSDFTFQFVDIPDYEYHIAVESEKIYDRYFSETSQNLTIREIQNKIWRCVDEVTEYK